MTDTEYRQLREERPELSLPAWEELFVYIRLRARRLSREKLIERRMIKLLTGVCPPEPGMTLGSDQF